MPDISSTNTNKSTLTLGVDLGGTKIETALVDTDGNIITSLRCPTDPQKNPDTVITDILSSIEKCLISSGQKAAALGIAAAGQIDKTSGTIIFSPNLYWHNVPLRQRMEEALEIPVVIQNDVRSAAYGEWRYGAGRGVNDLVCIFVGTGVGGGVIINGNLLEGCGNTAGELGHLTIVVNGRKCTCPNKGCLEAYAGGWGIAQRAQEVVRANPKSGKPILELAGNLEQITAATVSRASAAGDPLAKHLVEKTAEYLAAGIVNVINAFNPCLIILGGGVIDGFPEYIPLVEHQARAHALQAAIVNLSFKKSALAEKAGVIGAAALARSILPV